LYKEKKHDQLEYWELLYVEYAAQLTNMRMDVFNELKQIINIKLKLIVPELTALEPSFYQGWNKEHTLFEQIKKDREKNLIYGNLSQGIHKMDIKNSINKKLISIVYYLSYVELLSNQLSTKPILCLDDMDAELDAEKTQILCDFIQNSHHQVFITTVDSEKMMRKFESTSLFHVEHTKVQRVNTKEN